MTTVSGGNFNCKLGGFGLTRALRDSRHYRGVSGLGAKGGAAETQYPMKWVAPEVLVSDGAFTFPADVWAFGITAWEILSCGKEPYVKLTGTQVIDYLAIGKRLAVPRTLLPAALYAPIVQLLPSCWEKDPTQVFLLLLFHLLFIYFQIYSVSFLCFLLQFLYYYFMLYNIAKSCCTT